MATRDGDYLLSVGLDIGTTYSGYAFSFKNDPEKIICNKSWGETLGFQVRFIYFFKKMYVEK